MLISTQGVFRFDKETKEIYLDQFFPGVEVAAIKKDVPWDLKVSENVTSVPPPTDQEIEFTRRFAPAEALGKNVVTELTLAHF